MNPETTEGARALTRGNYHPSCACRRRPLGAGQRPGADPWPLRHPRGSAAKAGLGGLTPPPEKLVLGMQREAAAEHVHPIVAQSELELEFAPIAHSLKTAH